MTRNIYRAGSIVFLLAVFAMPLSAAAETIKEQALRKKAEAEARARGLQDEAAQPAARKESAGTKKKETVKKGTAGAPGGASSPSAPALVQEDPFQRAERDMLLLQADQKYKAGDKSGALADWQQAIKKGSVSTDVYFSIANTAIELRQPDVAEPWIKRYVQQAGAGGQYYTQVLGLMSRLAPMREALAAEERKEAIRRQREEEATAATKALWAPIKARLQETAAAPQAGADQASVPGTVFKDCNGCPSMVVVPAGRFTMGSPSSGPQPVSDEGPQHEVTISRAFAVGQYEVTFAEWDACAADGGCLGYRPEDRGWGRGQRPVIHVSWDDAQGYVQWLSRKTGKTYRLLSEAEWEYVARAGTTTPFWTGHCVNTEQANYDGNYDYNGCGAKTGTYREKTVPVGSFAPNAFGLYDTIGNVWEWVQDCGHDNYNGAPADSRAWESGKCELRVLRGGSWDSAPRNARAACRGISPAIRDSGRGLRVARMF